MAGMWTRPGRLHRSSSYSGPFSGHLSGIQAVFLAYPGRIHPAFRGFLVAFGPHFEGSGHGEFMPEAGKVRS